MPGDSDSENDAWEWPRCASDGGTLEDVFRGNSRVWMLAGEGRRLTSVIASSPRPEIDGPAIRS